MRMRALSTGVGAVAVAIVLLSVGCKSTSPASGTQVVSNSPTPRAPVESTPTAKGKTEITQSPEPAKGSIAPLLRDLSLSKIVARALTEAGIFNVREMAMITSKQRELVRRFVLRDANAEIDHAVSIQVTAGLRPSDPLRMLGLPSSVISACTAIGIKDVRDLANATRSKLAGIRNVGKAGNTSLDRAKTRADRVMAIVAPQADDLSPFVMRVLTHLGLDSIKNLDKAYVAKIEDSPAFGDEAMREIRGVVANAGLTLLKIEVADAPMGMDILIDGKVQRSVEKGKQEDPIVVVEDMRPLDDRKAVLLTARPSGGGATPMRWHRTVTLEKGQTTTVVFDFDQAPVLSTVVTPSHPLESNTFYAGDTITLGMENMDDHPNQHAFWLLFDPAAIRDGQAELSAGHQSPRTASLEFYGIDGWMDLRGRVDAELKDYLAARTGYDWHILHRALLPTRMIGVGKQVVWVPDREVANATLALVALGEDGYWGMTMRPISVMDLRPGAWALPQTRVVPGNWTAKQATSHAGVASSNTPRPRDVDRVHDALENVTFAATAGEPVDIAMRLGNFKDAEVPMTTCQMAFGDGSQRDIPVDMIDGNQVRHTWATPGLYNVTFTTTDLLGFQRTQALQVFVEAPPAVEVTAVPPEPKPEPKPEPPPIVASSVPTTPAESSFAIFRRGLEKWSGDSVIAVNGSDQPVGVALVHLHDVNNQEVLDLFDDALVRAFLTSGGSVYERDRQRFTALQGHRLPFNVEEMLALIPDAAPDRSMLTGDFQPNVPVRVMKGVSETENIGGIPRVEILEVIPAIERYQDILARARESEPFMSPHVFDYKLRRAEVTFEPLADTPLYTRRVRILGFVRLHDSESYEVLGSDVVETEIQDIVAAPRGIPNSVPGWNMYHRDFLHQLHDEALLEEPS